MPPILKTLVSMLLGGPDLKNQDCRETLASLTVCQTSLFNIKKYASSSGKSEHSLGREPPLPLYIDLKIHTETRSRKAVTQLYDLGLSVSYERVLQLQNQLATAVCEKLQDRDIVVPGPFRHRLFTVSAVDNLDHNTTSTTAKGSFQDTGISLFQFPASNYLGEKQNDIRLPASDAKKNQKLPDSYTTVQAVVLKTAKLSVPHLAKASAPLEGQLVGAQLKERSWLEQQD